ncbi:MAG: hypothetical protein Q9195_008434 [Heterodermia aff. obscurata]
MRLSTSTIPTLLSFFSFFPLNIYASPTPRNLPAKVPQQLPLPVQVIHQFPPGTWLENLAVQSSGDILVTLLTSPDVYQIDPTQQRAPLLIHSFTPYRGLLGITELHPNIFYLAAGNATYTSLDSPGTWAVFKLDLTHGATSPCITQTATFPNAHLLNGMTVLSTSQGTLLVADSLAGVVYRLDTTTGETAVVIDDPSMKGSPLGVNGLKIREGSLYFTNLGQGLFVRIPIREDGTPSGKAVVLSRDVTDADDFVLDDQGNAFVAENGVNNLAFLDLRSGVNATRTVVAGAPLEDPGVLAGPTAVGFGRGEGEARNLYVTTSGGLASGLANRTLGGTVSRIELGGRGWF